MAKSKQESRDKFLSKTQEVLYGREFKRADRAARERGDRS
ncbi:YfhE family protein [Ornithinibacillus contaminans]|nr:YfhE family protein [Ornithinibacillus contaminans]